MNELLRISDSVFEDATALYQLIKLNAVTRGELDSVRERWAKFAPGLLDVNKGTTPVARNDEAAAILKRIQAFSRKVAYWDGKMIELGAKFAVISQDNLINAIETAKDDMSSGFGAAGIKLRDVLERASSLKREFSEGAEIDDRLEALPVIKALTDAPFWTRDSCPGNEVASLFDGEAEVLYGLEANGRGLYYEQINDNMIGPLHILNTANRGVSVDGARCSLFELATSAATRALFTALKSCVVRFRVTVPRHGFTNAAGTAVAAHTDAEMLELFTAIGRTENIIKTSDDWLVDVMTWLDAGTTVNQVTDGSCSKAGIYRYDILSVTIAGINSTGGLYPAGTELESMLGGGDGVDYARHYVAPSTKQMLKLLQCYERYVSGSKSQVDSKNNVRYRLNEYIEDEMGLAADFFSSSAPIYCIDFWLADKTALSTISLDKRQRIYRQFLDLANIALRMAKTDSGFHMSFANDELVT